jgi:hypothetical protein
MQFVNYVSTTNSFKEFLNTNADQSEVLLDFRLGLSCSYHSLNPSKTTQTAPGIELK